MLKKLCVATVWWLVALTAAPVANAGEGGGWIPDYTAMDSDPETQQYITHARSELGGDCCVWADGFQLGKVYKFDRNNESILKVAFYSWSLEADGYHAVVWDYFKTGEYVEVVADYRAFAPGNPTGGPIVWIRIKSNTVNVIEVRCYGGGPEG